jgi:hypothetical protein
MYYLWLLVFPKGSRIVKYFDYFAERHPYSAMFLPICAAVPFFIILHSVSLLHFVSEIVKILLMIGIFVPTAMVSLLFFRAIRFLPSSQNIPFSSQARTSFPDFGSYNPEHDPERSFLGRFVLRHPDFTLFWLMFWLIPFHQISYQMLLSGGQEENAFITSIFAFISIAAAMISVVLFFKAFRLIVHAEGGMGGMSGKAYR